MSKLSTVIRRVFMPLFIPMIVIAGALSFPAVASAHARLESSDPPADAVLATAPTVVTATFNEELEPAFAAMTVVGPDQAQWAAGAPEVSGAQMSMPVKPLGPVGIYTVNYRVTSADGHVVEGSWAFELTTPGTTQATSPAATVESTTTAATPSAAPPPSDDGGVPVWPFLVAAPVVVIGAVLGMWALARRRSQRR